jgi:hypothetical protein
LQGAFFALAMRLAMPIQNHMISQQFDTFQVFRLFRGQLSQNVFRDHK